MQNSITFGVQFLAPVFRPVFKYFLLAGFLQNVLAQQDDKKQIVSEVSKIFTNLINSTFGKSYYDEFAKAGAEVASLSSINTKVQNETSFVKLKKATEDKDSFEKNVLGSIEPLMNGVVIFFSLAVIVATGVFNYLGWRVEKNQATGENEVLGRQGSFKFVVPDISLDDVKKFAEVIEANKGLLRAPARSAMPMDDFSDDDINEQLIDEELEAKMTDEGAEAEALDEGTEAKAPCHQFLDVKLAPDERLEAEVPDERTEDVSTHDECMGE